MQSGRYQIHMNSDGFSVTCNVCMEPHGVPMLVYVSPQDKVQDAAPHVEAVNSHENMWHSGKEYNNSESDLESRVSRLERIVYNRLDDGK